MTDFRLRACSVYGEVLSVILFERHLFRRVGSVIEIENSLIDAVRLDLPFQVGFSRHRVFHRQAPESHLPRLGDFENQ